MISLLFCKPDIINGKSRKHKPTSFAQDNHLAITCEILKTQFNLILQSGSEEPANEAEEAMYLKLMPVLTALLYVSCSTEEKVMELRGNIANLLTR